MVDGPIYGFQSNQALFGDAGVLKTTPGVSTIQLHGSTFSPLLMLMSQPNPVSASSYIPIANGWLAGAVSATNGSPTLTFTAAPSPALAAGQSLWIVGDATNTQYTIASGSGTSYTLTSNFAGATNTAAFASLTNPIYTLDNSCGPHWGIWTLGGSQRFTYWGTGFQMSGSNSNGMAWTDAQYTLSMAAMVMSPGPALAGTCACTNLSATFTFSQSQTLSVGQQLYVQGDATTTAYSVVSGSGTTWTVSPAFAGATNAAAVVNAGNQIGGTWNSQGFFVIGSDPVNNLEPFSFQVTSGQFWFSYLATDGVERRVKWAVPSKTGLYRFFIFIDVNRTQFTNLINVYMDQNDGNGPKLVTYVQNVSPAVGVGLSSPFGYPFMAGNLQSSFLRYNTNASATDFILCGLNFESGFRYVDGAGVSGGTAGKLYRADNSAAWGASMATTGFNDQYAFFTSRSTTGSLLPLCSNGAGPNLLAGTCSVNNGSQSLTFSSPQSLSQGQFLQFSGDSTNGYYMVTSSGINSKSYNVTPAYKGSSSTNAVATIGLNDPFEVPVTINSNNKWYSMGFLCNGVLSQLDISNIRVKDLRINAHQKNASSTISQGGPAIVVPTGLNLWFENVVTNSGLNGLTVCAHGNNIYLIKCHQCDFEGGYIPIYLNNVIGDFVDCMGPNGWNYGVVVMGSSVTFKNMFFTVSSQLYDIYCSAADAANGPNKITIENYINDVEGGGYPLYANFYFSGCESVVLRDCNPSQLASARAMNPNGGAFAVLGPTSGNIPVQKFTLVDSVVYANLTYSGVGQFVIKDPTWMGEIRNWVAGGQAMYADSTGGMHGLKAFNIGWPSGLPCLGYYSAGNHIAYNQGSAPGEATEWKCTGSGQYGTTTLPVWSVSTAARSLNSNPCAAYIQQNSAFNGPASSLGWFSNIECLSLLNALFTGAAFTPPTSVYLGLSSSYSDRKAAAVELTAANSPGYARQLLTFGAPSAGSITSNVLATFPAATAAWNVNSLLQNVATGTANPIQYGFLTTASTAGNQIAAFTLATPTTIKQAGASLSFASGSITLQNVQSSVGGWTNYAWNLMASALLNGTAPTIPATWFIALSSTPIALDGTGGTEATGGGYARASVANSATNFNAAANTSYLTCYVTNKVAINFPIPTGAWSTAPLAFWGLYDAATGGNCWASGMLPAPAVVSSASSPQPNFAVNAFNVAIL